MQRRFIVSLILLLSVLLLTAEQVLVRIPDTDVERLYLENWDIASHVPGQHLDIVVGTEQVAGLRQSYPELTIVATEQDLKANLQIKTRDIPGYRTYDMLENELLTLATQHSDIAMVTTLGNSWGKQAYENGDSNYSDFQHEILALKLSDNPTVNEDEPVIYFVGEHHAREPISTEVVMNLLTYMLDNYLTDPTLQDYINNYQIWFIPLLNPDGHKLVLSEQDIWWRKNIRDNDGNSLISLPSSSGYATDGVDLNRNYGWNWGNLGSSDVFIYATYHGTEPFSEPETQAFRNFITELKPLGGIGYHSHGNLVLYPYGYGFYTETADCEVMEDIAVDMAQLIHNEDGNNYTPNAEWELYPCMGGADDYAYGTQRVFGFTIELANVFIPAASQIPQICQENLNGQLYFLDRMNRSMLQGHVLDSVTGEPVEAEIYINEIDGGGTGQSSYKTNQFGSFYRPLNTGDYTFTVSADGYITQNDIPFTVYSDSVSVVDISLDQVGMCNLNIRVYDSTGSPMRDAIVTVYAAQDTTCMADTEGVCYFDQIPAGRHRVTVTYPEWSSIDRVLEVAPNTTTWEFTLYPPAAVYDFESNTTGWQCSGAWGRSDSEYYSGTHSLSSKYPGYSMDYNSYARIVSPLSNLDNLSISFWSKAFFSSPDNQCYLQLSYNNSFWFTIDSFLETTDWEFHQYDLSQYPSDVIYIRFYQYIAGTDADGIYIDNFSTYQAETTVDENEQVSENPGKVTINVYPNPFGESLSINVKNLSPNEEIFVYNIKGQRIRAISNNTKGEITWDGRDKRGYPMRNGVYFFKAGNAHTKVLLIR